MLERDEEGGDAEPEEPDPEADLPDPESELPDVPSVSVPEPSTAESEAPAELRRTFWTTVAVFNVALFATSLGAMMLALGSRRQLGAGLLLVGLVSFLRGYHKYREAERVQSERGRGE